MRINLDRLDECIDFVISVMKNRYEDLDSVPYHSRLRHFPDEFMEQLKDFCFFTSRDLAVVLIDLVTVSVLLDAGAGSAWIYTLEDGRTLGRSEGLGVASLCLFLRGFFSSFPEKDPLRVDAQRLIDLNGADLRAALQVSDENRLNGLENRLEILVRLGRQLEKFGMHRPADVVASELMSVKEIDLKVFWSKFFDFFSPIFPSVDVWNFPKFPITNFHVSFHKLLQWLLYSYVEIFEKFSEKSVENKCLQTGLPEYRNGGLLIDFGVIEFLAGQDSYFEISSDEVVQWRACTVVLLDKIHKLVNQKLKTDLCLSSILEGGTWMAGRKIALEKRPPLGDAPIRLRLDGTVF